MRFKCHGHGCTVNGSCLFDDFVKKGLVSDMNTVKIADGNHSALEGFLDLVELVENFHSKLSRKCEKYFNIELDMNYEIDVCNPLA